MTSLEDQLESFRRRRSQEGPAPLPPPPSGPEVLLWEERLPLPEGLPEDRIFLDIETPGFPSGLPVILVGLARRDGASLLVRQWAPKDLDGEGLLLEALVRHLDATVVTYNGRSFDLPRLRERALVWGVPFPEPAHDDLLPSVRALYRESHPSLSLSALEASLLLRPRGEDLPGEAIGSHWTLYLKSQDRRWLEPLALHNRRDLETLAHLDRRVVLDASRSDAPPDLAFGQGHLCMRLGRPEEALQAYLRAALDGRLAQRASALAGRAARKSGRPSARYWQDASGPLPSPRSLLELARALEREENDREGALRACRDGLASLALLGRAGLESPLHALLERRARRLEHVIQKTTAE